MVEWPSLMVEWSSLVIGCPSIVIEYLSFVVFFFFGWAYAAAVVHLVKQERAKAGRAGPPS